MTEVGYYKGISYVVMHLMPDPMQVKSCIIRNNGNNKTSGCLEADNKACSHGGAVGNEREECVDTETKEIEWSDVTAFFQFGFRLRTGIVRKSYHEVHTSDWLGPYNMILAPIEKHHQEKHETETETERMPGTGNHDQKDLYVSRYVKTPWTATELQRPFAGSNIFNFDAGILEEVVGTTAINTTIHAQRKWNGTPKTLEHENAATTRTASVREGRKAEAVNDGNSASISGENDDPYARYSKTCSHGDLRPILPRLEVTRTTHPSVGSSSSNDGDGDGKSPNTTYSMKVDYPILSLPEGGIDDLYKLWPTLKRHLGPQFPLRGPYCYGNDPNRAYAINLSYDSAATAEASTWKGVKGCLPPWPCWKGDPKPPVLPPSSVIPEDNHSEGSYVLDPMGLEFAIVYGIGFLLVVSLVFNCRLANRLKSLQQNGGSAGGGDAIPNRRRPQNRSEAAATTTTSTSALIAHRNSSGASPSDYLREAAGGQNSGISSSNILEEPLLTASSDDPESTEGVEESKQEAD